MAEVTPDPKPRRREVLGSPDYLALVARLLREFPACELCAERRSQSAHHVVSRRAGGDDWWVNLVALCGSGTTGCHGDVEHSREARSRLRAKLRHEVVVYVLERKGEGWLSMKYPEAE